MKKILLAACIIFSIAILLSCASPGSLRKDGAYFTFTTAKGTPQEFGKCLVGQLDEKFYLNTHSLRDNPNGNTTILTIAGGQELKMMFDINKANKGLNILVYGDWFQDKAFTDLVFPKIKECLKTCDATENIQLRKTKMD